MMVGEQAWHVYAFPGSLLVFYHFYLSTRGFFNNPTRFWDLPAKFTIVR